MAKTKQKTPPKSPKKPSLDTVLEAYGRLKDDYPDPRTELTYTDPYQLLVAVILSAQCTDARVNMVTPELFRQYPTAEKMAKAPPAKIEKLIHSCGFYKMKTRSIIKTSNDLMSKFNGKVPNTLEELITLAGVGRKTASVVLNQAFDEPAIAVDTHVLRVSNRLGWAHGDDAVKVEMQLRELLPKELWSAVNGMLILHGRRICKARKPLCKECKVVDLCPSAEL